MSTVHLILYGVLFVVLLLSSVTLINKLSDAIPEKTKYIMTMTIGIIFAIPFIVVLLWMMGYMLVGFIDVIILIRGGTPRLLI